MPASIQISGIMLRKSGDYTIVEAEIEGEWREVIREYGDNFSHIVEPAGMRQAKTSELANYPNAREA